ncbi:zinc-dependent peptidase [Marilutibacter alkalisoli]|nr:zinc-dependent peptidase [Lysobacter alkalisoli]
MAGCLALCSLLAGTAPAQAALPADGPRPGLVEDGLTAAEVSTSRQLLDDALRLLPPRWRQALDPRIRVEWRDDLPDDVHGRTRGPRLLLDRRLLDGLSGDATMPVPDAAQHTALAAVIHELAHYYDRSRGGRLSGDPRLLDLAGWQVSPMRLGLRTSRNALSDRSPDPYELTAPAEFVAVNLEYFLLDPAYACRRPALYRHFAAHFGVEPPMAVCAPDLVYIQAPPDESSSALLRIDPERVHAIDYLLAEPDHRVMSRWGHSMLRVVVCAPGRPRGPDCRLDLQHHLVLSFRAFVDDVQISNLRGLTGSYPSRLFVLPLDQVIEEYTRVELRGLRSVPLRLQRDEVATLLERAAQLHWGYDGRYYFLSNNCAVETFKLLHDGVPRLASERLGSITPTGLLRRLSRAGIADTSVLDDADEALRLGYRFEALSTYYQEMYTVARHALDLPSANARDWLAMSPSRRAPWLGQADLRASAALLLLEQAAQRREELQARDDLKRRFLGRGAASRDAETSAGLEALNELLWMEGGFSRPATLLQDGGYGLPQHEERNELGETGNRLAKRWLGQRAGLHRTAHDLLSTSRQDALAAIEANIDTLGQQLRQLHREVDGFQLQAPPTVPSPM